MNARKEVRSTRWRGIGLEVWRSVSVCIMYNIRKGVGMGYKMWLLVMSYGLWVGCGNCKVGGLPDWEIYNNY